MSDNPAEAGKNLQDPSKMDDEPNESTNDEQSTEQTNVKDLQIAWSGGNQYRVFSGGDTQNAYQVDLNGLTCTCEHGEHNGHTTEACKHIKKAIMAHDSHPDLERFAFQQLTSLFSEAHQTLSEAREAKQLYESGSGGSQQQSNDSSSNDESGSTNDEQDSEGDVTEKDPTDEQQDLIDSLYDWFEQASDFNDFDAEIIELKWVNADGQDGIHINRQPFGAGYYDLDDGEWVDKEGFEDEKDSLKDAILSPRDEIQWFGEPDYVWFISSADAQELV